MPRVSLITREKIANAVDQLSTCGNADPSANEIRAYLKKMGGPDDKVGSQNKIQSYLDELRVEKKKQNPLDVGQTLPQAVAMEIHRALTASATQARESIENEILRAQTEIEALVADGESLESQVESLSEALICRTTERDALSGQLEAVGMELTRWKDAAALEQATFLATQVDLARAQVRADTMDATAAALRQEALTLRQEIASVMGELAVSRAAGEIADRNLVAAQFRVQTESDLRLAAEYANKHLLTAVQGVDAAATRAASAEAATVELRAQVASLQEILKYRGNARSILLKDSRLASRTMRTRKRISSRAITDLTIYLKA